MTTDVAVVEDVWSAAFDALATRRDVLYLPDAWEDPTVLRAAVENTQALVVRNRTRVTRELLASAPHLRLVARAGVGLDNIDVEAARELGIEVVAPLGANATSVAEHTLGLALALARHTLELDRSVRAGQWSRTPGRELSGRTWGTLSAGATARRTLELARGLGMKTVAHDPYIDPADARLVATGCRLLPLEEVLAQADVLSVHLPATSRTTGMLDAALLARMPRHALLINTGRGEVVDEAALADALGDGRLAGAALDVRETEPPRPGRLEQLPNLVLTPHVAGVTADSQRRIAELLSEDIEAVLSGRRAGHSVSEPTAPQTGVDG